MSTTRSQLDRFARDLGNVEAVEHGYQRADFGSSNGRRTARGQACHLSRGQPTDQPFRPAIGLGPHRR